MDRDRLTAFTDGVLAVIITIMVLEMKAPHGASLADLIALWPVFTSYVLSFIYIGIYWNNHHHFFQLVKTVDGKILWANLHLLFWLSMVPFATAWMGENRFAPIPTAFYGVALLGPAIAWYLMQKAIIRQQGPDSPLRRALGRDLKGKLSPVRPGLFRRRPDLADPGSADGERPASFEARLRPAPRGSIRRKSPNRGQTLRPREPRRSRPQGIYPLSRRPNLALDWIDDVETADVELAGAGADAPGRRSARRRAHDAGLGHADGLLRGHAVSRQGQVRLSRSLRRGLPDRHRPGAAGRRTDPPRHPSDRGRDRRPAARPRPGAGPSTAPLRPELRSFLITLKIGNST
jgi:uncharacterized membrane protein